MVVSVVPTNPKLLLKPNGVRNPRNCSEPTVVEVSFTSLKSGSQYSIPCTLQEHMLPVKINQSSSDAILLYRLDTNRWEDIRLSSIDGYTIPSDE